MRIIALSSQRNVIRYSETRSIFHVSMTRKKLKVLFFIYGSSKLCQSDLTHCVIGNRKLQTFPERSPRAEQRKRKVWRLPCDVQIHLVNNFFFWKTLSGMYYATKVSRHLSCNKWGITVWPIKSLFWKKKKSTLQRDLMKVKWLRLTAWFCFFTTRRLCCEAKKIGVVKFY